MCLNACSPKSPSSTPQVKEWIELPERLEYLRSVFSTTTRFGYLQSVNATVAGRNVYLRFKCSTGDAMGMNMVGKGMFGIVAWVTLRASVL